MAKKEIKESIDFDIFKSVQKEVNDRIKIGSLNAVIDPDLDGYVKAWIPTGSSMLDTLISNKYDVGGWPCGRIIEIAGWESSGKTLIALEAVRSVQNLGGYAMYIDIEHSLDFEWIKSLGIDVKRCNWVSNINTVEEIFETIEITLQKIEEHATKLKDKPVLIVWDSIAATTTQAEANSEYSDSEMAQRARVIGRSFRKINSTLNQYNVCLLCLNQLRSNIGNMFQKETTPGGNAVKFASAVRLHLARSSPIEKQGATVGYVTSAKIIKNKVGPNRRMCKFDILFVKGIDETLAIFDQLVASGDIECPKSSRSFTFDYGKGQEKHAKDKWPELFNGNIDVRNWAKEKAKKSLEINLANLDYTRGKVSEQDLEDFEYGIIKDNHEIIDENTGEVVGYDNTNEDNGPKNKKKK